ncbi:MAG: M3 family oligoendopeptidase [Candidatus Izemoplasma sp.]|nr:M3 family oligoendopeptidase [Candidatus Izemoplasma sp.]
MTFNDFKYERPDVDALKKRLETLINRLGDETSFEQEKDAINQLLKEKDHYETMDTLASIRNSVNTKDAFYEAEKAFFDNVNPELQAYDHKFKKALLESKHIDKLKAVFGDLMFDQAERELKTFDESIIPLLQEENSLSTQYQKLLASAEIEFEGEIRNLSQMSPFLQHKDRTIRHDAQLAVSSFLEQNETEIDAIYDKMVSLRHKIAKALGYDNFIQLGYDRLGRLDYGPKDVETYRKQILEDVVPLVAELTKRQADRIGIEELKSWDLGFKFKSGNPTPKGDRAWQVAQAKDMYNQMSDETSEFFNFMLDNELLELDSKPGKAGGGYCTFISDYKAPYIFANFNGTSHDVDVLTHEAGHAFQIFQSRDLISPYRWPTFEAAEIHSMSMEFLAWPWIDKFFVDDTEKYKFQHLAGAVSFLPYGALVDHFQHEVYTNPEMTPDERKDTWRKLEKQYLSYKDYGDDDFLEKGTYWFRQGHIFGMPFYYIDYTLAQVLAFQYFNLSRDNHDNAFKNYLALCQLGGSKSFVELIHSANLKNPFKEGTIKKVIKPIKNYLNGIDDTKL